MKYYVLTDIKHKEILFRVDKHTCESFTNGAWSYNGLLVVEYFNDQSPYYECYTEISESEAMEIVRKQSTGNSKKST